MTKYFTKFTPENANGNANLNKQINNAKAYHLIVIRNDKIHRLASLWYGYPSQASRTVYTTLFLSTPKGSYWHAEKIQNGDEYDAINFPIRQLFGVPESAYYSVDFFFRKIAEFFGYKNFEIFN